jgi:pentatricopeptide repeat protein
MAQKAIELFSKITNPNEILLCLLLNSCAQVGTTDALNFGRKVWSQMSLANHKNVYILNAAFDMFIKCGDISSAESLFAKMKRIVIDYGQMMKCFNAHSMPMKTLNLYEKMRSEGIEADSITFLLLVDACAQIGLESRCRSIVKQIPHVILTDVQLQTALIHMWVGKI